MSTKIFDAYKVTGMNARQLLDFLIEIKHDNFNMIAEYLTANFNKTSSLTELADEFKKQFSSGQRDPYNFESSVMIYPYKKHFYCVFFGLNDRVNKIVYMDILHRNKTFKKHFKDFHYQNQCERPNAISAKEWSNRKKVWNELLTGYTFKEAGYVFPLIDVTDAYELAFAIKERWHKRNTVVLDLAKEEIEGRVTDRDTTIGRP